MSYYIKYHLACMVNNVDRVIYGRKSETDELDSNGLIRCAVEEEHGVTDL